MLIKIYRIENSINNMIYIGSTIQALNIRLKNHRDSSNHGSNSMLHSFMRDHGVYNFTINQINEIEVNDLDQARFEEQQEINKYNREIILNTNNAINVNENQRLYYKEWYQRNRDENRLYSRNYQRRTYIPTNLVLNRNVNI